MRFDAAFLQTATGGVWHDGEASTEDVSIDSRTLPVGALYVALRGERHDGHAFVGAARDAGACAAMVDRKGQEELGDAAKLPLLVVEDTLGALQRLATAHRRRLRAKIIGVCGSNGKTTTKEMIASVLGTAGPTHRTTGNLNNHIGLPLSLLRMKEGQRFGVLEAGMNHPGELRVLGAILEPDIAVLTNIQAEHLEGLGTLENIARAEGELFEGLSGVGVVPADDPLVESHALPKNRTFTIRTFGESRNAHIRLEGFALSDDGGSLVSYRTPRGELSARLPQLGKHNAHNAAAAVAVGLELGLELEQIARGLEQTPLVDRRLRIHKTSRLLVLDDCYNANPGSMGAALEVLRVLGKERRKVALLGDMLELGEATAREHDALGALAAQLGVDVLCAFGPNASRVAAAHPNSFASEDMATFIARVEALVAPGDVVLVKGSRGMKMERVLPALGVTTEEVHN